MGKSSTSCFNIISCGCIKESDVSSENKSHDKPGWSLRKKSPRRHAPSSTVGDENITSSEYKEIPEPITISSEPQVNSNISEKTSDSIWTEETPNSITKNAAVSTVAAKPVSEVDVKCEPVPVESESESEAAVLVIQAAVRRFLAEKQLVKHKNVVKLQAAVRGHLVRNHAVGTLRCVQAIVKMQALVRARREKGVQNAGVNSNPTHISVEKLLSNRLARQLLESTPKTKQINIKCDPSKSDSAWNWLERWMSVSTPETLQPHTTDHVQEKDVNNTESEVKMVISANSVGEATVRYEEKENIINIEENSNVKPHEEEPISESVVIPVLETETKPKPKPIPENPVSETKPEPIPDNPVLETETKPKPIPENPVSETKPEPIPDNPVLETETKPKPIPENPVSETKPEPIPENSVSETKPEPIPENSVSETKPESIPENSVSETKPEPIFKNLVSETKPEPIPENTVLETIPIPEKLVLETEPKHTDKQIPTDQPDSEGRKNVHGSRKASNPAFIAAQSKFEELNSPKTNPLKSPNTSNQYDEPGSGSGLPADISSTDQNDLAGSFSPADIGSSDLRKPDNEVNSCADISHSAPGQAPVVTDVEPRDYSVTHGSRVAQNGSSECGTELSITSTLDSPDQFETENKKSEEVKGVNDTVGDTNMNIDNNNNKSIDIATPEKQVDEKLDNSDIKPKPKNESSHHEPAVQLSVSESSPRSHITNLESQGTPSSQISTTSKKTKKDKKVSSQTRKSWSYSKKASPVSSSVDYGLSSVEQLPKEPKPGKRRNVFGSPKPDHSDHESPVPSYMQPTESARAKAVASPRSSPDVHDKDFKKRHSLPGTVNAKQGSPRVQRSMSQTLQPTKGNSNQERKWQR